MRLRTLVVAVTAATVLPATPAVAAQHFTAPEATKTTAPCPREAPCRIDGAVSAALDGDEVIVLPGTYTIGFELEVAKAVTIRGEDGRPRPRLTGTSILREPTLFVGKGAVARHLEVRATAPGQTAFEVDGSGGIGERLVLWSRDGNGARVNASASRSILRDSVAETAGSSSEVAGVVVRDSGQGTASELVNVTAWAPAGAATAVDCLATRSVANIAHVVARGSGGDIAGSSTVGACRVTHSNFRSFTSPSITALEGNQEGDPRLAAPALGNFTPLAGSPLIDAGRADQPGLGAADLAGRARVAGSAPDIGAYEHVPGATSDPVAPPPPTPDDRGEPEPGPTEPEPTEPAPTTPAESGPQTPQTSTPPPAAEASPSPADTPDESPGRAELPAGVPVPELARTVAVARASGTVRVRARGAATSEVLPAGAAIPVGSVVDARAGAVRLSSALPGEEGFQTGTFSHGRFVVRQAPSGAGTVDILLQGGDFGQCKKRARGARAAARRRDVRRLWARDRGGRFRTHGRNSVAVVRGTRWLTVDRCEGTLTRVVEGAVDVRDRWRGAVRRVRAGQSLLVRAR